MENIQKNSMAWDLVNDKLKPILENGQILKAFGASPNEFDLSVDRLALSLKLANVETGWNFTWKLNKIFAQEDVFISGIREQILKLGLLPEAFLEDGQKNKTLMEGLIVNQAAIAAYILHAVNKLKDKN